MSASKEEIREAMRILWNIDVDAEDVDEATRLDSLFANKEGLVEVEVEEVREE